MEISCLRSLLIKIYYIYYNYILTDYDRAVRNVGRCVNDLWPNCHGRGVDRAWPMCHLAEPSVYHLINTKLGAGVAPNK